MKVKNNIEQIKGTYAYQRMLLFSDITCLQIDIYSAISKGILFKWLFCKRLVKLAERQSRYLKYQMDPYSFIAN